MVKNGGAALIQQKKKESFNLRKKAEKNLAEFDKKQLKTGKRQEGLKWT